MSQKTEEGIRELKIIGKELDYTKKKLVSSQAELLIIK
jgi:hypothetical protein